MFNTTKINYFLGQFIRHQVHMLRRESLPIGLMNYQIYLHLDQIDTIHLEGLEASYDAYYESIKLRRHPYV